MNLAPTQTCRFDKRFSTSYQFRSLCKTFGSPMIIISAWARVNNTFNRLKIIIKKINLTIIYLFDWRRSNLWAFQKTDALSASTHGRYNYHRLLLALKPFYRSGHYLTAALLKCHFNLLALEKTMFKVNWIRCNYLNDILNLPAICNSKLYRCHPRKCIFRLHRL